MRIDTTQRCAIRTTAPNGEVLLLAVPPMHRSTPSEIRVKVFEYVLRRQMGLAEMLAHATADDIAGVAGARARLAALLEQTPHRNARGAQAA